MNNYQFFYLNGVFTLVEQKGKRFDVQEYKSIDINKSWQPFGWSRLNASQEQRQKAITMFKLLQTSEI